MVSGDGNNEGGDLQSMVAFMNCLEQTLINHFAHRSIIKDFRALHLHRGKSQKVFKPLTTRTLFKPVITIKIATIEANNLNLHSQEK